LDKSAAVKSILNKKDVIASNYEVKFFIEGNNFYQKYRVKGKDGKTYLLKIYNSSKLSSESLSESGLLEVEILKLLNDDGIGKYVDNGELVKDNQKFHFIVLEFASGETLHDKLEREGVFSPYSTVPIIIGLLDALSVLHSHPKTIIHNNINLNSVTLDYSDNREKPILTSFDFARYISSRSNSVDLQQLSPFYVAPELFNGVFTPQSDIFSVGALLYHLIVGIPPWYVEIPDYQFTDKKFIDAIYENRLKPLSFGTKDTAESIDDHLKETIKMALAINVDDRFKNTEEFVSALKRETAVAFSESTKDTHQKVIKKEGEGFSAIAGMRELKDILYNDVIRAVTEKELYQSYGITIPNGMLLYGPPGCGKTFISERFAEEVGFNFLQLNPSDIKSKYINATEEKMAEIFKEAAKNAPTIIFIDEIDAIVPSREGDLHHMNASSVNEFLAQMSNCSEKGIFVIAASNRPEKIDPAVLRTGRIDKIIYLPCPDFEARASMFELYLKNRPVDLGVNYQTLAKKTENYVSSDIKFLVDEASRTALQTKERITQEILEKAISSNPPSVSYEELKKYELLKEKLEKKRTARKPNKKSIGFIQN